MTLGDLPQRNAAAAAETFASVLLEEDLPRRRQECALTELGMD